MSESFSFSRQVKDELIEIACQDHTNKKLCLLSCLMAAARLRPGLVQLTTSHPDFAKLVSDWFMEIYNEEVVYSKGKELFSITINNRAVYKRIATDLNNFFGYETGLNSLGIAKTLSLQQVQAAVRCMFLACGSIGDPNIAYHLEFSLRRLPAALWLMPQLEILEMKGHLLKRQGYSVIYLKDGRQISDWLLKCGAHTSLLSFESLRVDKEMRNSVNRVVNCDSANSQRIANASARQLDLLRSLEAVHGFGFLPEDLLAAARARLDNPDFSLKELGEVMNPPLGKSGMNHRLKKLEKIAAEILSQNKRMQNK